MSGDKRYWDAECCILVDCSDAPDHECCLAEIGRCTHGRRDDEL